MIHGTCQDNDNMINLNEYHFKKFSKEERSTFSYWYYHWKAYNLVAMHLNCWKMKYIFHDFEKPWLKLFASYETVQRIHRQNNKHHLQYPDKNKIDWQALAIDWECSRFTKNAAPLTARQEMYNQINKHPEYEDLLKSKLLPVLDKLSI